MNTAESTRRRQHWGPILIALCWVGAVVGLVVAVVGGRPVEEAVEVQSGFTSIQRQTLASIVSFSGTVQYDAPVVVLHGGAGGAASAGDNSGQPGASAATVEERVTWIVEPGVEVDNGDVLYEVNDEPIVFLTGSVPSYRTLERDDTGDDVAVIQSALVDLGYDPDGLIEIDGEFGPLTEQMIESWQTAVGSPVDGVLDRGEVVVRPTASRVASVTMSQGDVVGTDSTMLELSSVGRVIELDVEADRVHLLTDGQVVDVRLPDRTIVTGEVVSVDTVVDPATGTVRVIVESNGIDDASDQVPVTVLVSTDLAIDALVVETEAVMSTLANGYTLEVLEEDGTRRLLPIEVGVTDGTVVVISGVGLEEGLLVRAPI